MYTTYISVFIAMLSKSKGQTLRVAAVMHILFQIQQTDPEQVEIAFKDEISEKALQAAIDFVQTSIQHAAYIAGRSTVSKEVEIAEAGMDIHTVIDTLLSDWEVYNMTLYIYM